MRRAIAFVMLVIFGFLPGVPLLAAGRVSQSKLPACCRRDGKHHCMMRMTLGESAGTRVMAVPEKCPFCPVSRPVNATQNHEMTPAPCGVFYASIQSHPACHAQTATQWRISFDRSRQKRGPPAPPRIG